jgi:hypothetical protein
MLALIDSGTFDTEQFIDWEVLWYDSNSSVPESGLGFRMGELASTFTTSGMAAAANPATYMEANSTPIITDDGSTWKYGRAPLVSEYWESGAPPGVTIARRNVLHWRGSLASDLTWLEGTTSFWIGIAGSGNVRVVYDGSTVLNTTLETDSVSYTSLLAGGTGKQLDIYYWQVGEAWGGIVAKYVPQTAKTDTAATIEEYREAPVVSASIFPYTSAAIPEVLEKVEKATLVVDQPTAPSRMVFDLPLAGPDETTGWFIAGTAPRTIIYKTVDVTDFTMKRGHLVKLRGGFQNELYDRFTGYIDDFQERSGTITVECVSLDARMGVVHVENFPDRISYATFGYFDHELINSPVQDIPAYDAWPLEHTIKDLCYKSKLDPKLFYGNRQFNNAGTVEDKIDRFGTIIVKDTFTDPDTTSLADHDTDTGHTWNNTAGLTIQSNALYYTSTTLTRTYVNAELHNNMRVEGNVTFSAGATTGQGGVFWRNNGDVGGSMDAYQYTAFRTSSSQVTVRLVVYDAAVPTTLSDNTGVSWASGATRKLIADVASGTVTMYLADDDGNNLQFIDEITDSSIALDEPYAGIVMDAPSGGNITHDDFHVYQHQPSRVFRCKATSGDLIKLQRQSHYGNAGLGFNETQPVDDSYIYAPDTARAVLDWCRELADSLGYDFRTDARGSIVLMSRNNPHKSTELTSGTATFNAGAYQGMYQEITSTFTETVRVFGSRIDLVVGRQEDLGTVSYTVRTAGGTIVATGGLDISLTNETNGIFLYHDRFTTTGDNAAITTLYSGDWGEYVVELSDSAGTEWWLDTVFTYDVDPNTTLYPETFKTDKAILQLTTTSQATDARNHIVVVGKRKSALTDSAKFRNPNNPAHEFFVAVGSDPNSIWNQDADTYFGTKLSTVIVDNKVADQDYADWVAQALLIRQRAPTATPSFDHTIIPNLEPRDPVLLSDENYDTITSSTEAWVLGFTEEYTPSSATSKIKATGYQEIPSYEPQQDLSLELLDSLFGGKPAANFSIWYKSLDGVTVTDPGPNIPQLFTEEVHQTYTIATDGSGDYANMVSETIWPPIPDSIRIEPTTTQAVDNSKSSLPTLKNNPYMKFTHVYDYTAQKIHLPFLAGDGGTNYSTYAAWGVSPTSVDLAYRGLDSSLGFSEIYSGESPFYDPYTSELPDPSLIIVQFDALVSGFYRVSVMAKTQDGVDPTQVAWLTEPGVEETDAEAHWSFVRSGANRQYIWDGVDNVGKWNEQQSEEYSWLARGVFEQDQKPSIGKGFYVWNNRNSKLATISGQKSSGKLVFNDDHYAQFYVKVEVRTDAFAETTEPIRVSRTDDLLTSGQINSQSEIYIYTHLPPPTQVTISEVEDWDPTQGVWDRDVPSEAGWVTTPDSAATIRNGKPVRLTFSAVARPGTLFGGDNDYTSFKLNRTVHLNVNIADIFMLLMGKPWHGKTDREEKRLVCRKLTNSTNTLRIQDTSFRTGASLELAAGKWVFEPRDFKVNDQELEYMDYLQIEDIPEYTINRQAGESTSRFIMAYMNYLFYISTYTQDRSGRMVWALDTNFVDKTKILGNTFDTAFPEDLENYFNRTMLTRQWNDPDYITTLSNKWNIPGGSQKYIQFFWKRLEPNDTAAASTLRLNSSGGNVTGDLDTAYTDEYSADLKGDSKLPADYITVRQLGEYSGGSATAYFGDWTWEGAVEEDTSIFGFGGPNLDPLWIPAPTRDWHSYFLVPPMPLQLASADSYWYTQVQVGGDKDEAAGLVWFSRCHSMTSGQPTFYPGISTVEYSGEGKKFIRGGDFDYTRQDEMIHYEHLRGWRTVGKLESGTRNSVLVQPTAGPYYMNMFFYDEILTASSKLWLSGVYQGTIIDIADRPIGAISSWFESTFRHQYNWESASYFPIDSVSGRFHPEYLYSKYDPRDYPSWLSFDGGAWTGWKDDDTGGTKLRWGTDLTLMKFYVTPSRGGEDNGEDNIFLTAAPPYAVAPQATENRDMLFSLALVNNRRKQSVAGK